MPSKKKGNRKQIKKKKKKLKSNRKAGEDKHKPED